MTRYIEVSFSDELPPEKEKLFLISKNKEMIIGSRHHNYIDNVRQNRFEPIEWFSFWLKKINENHT